VDRYPAPPHIREPRYRMLWNAACLLLERNSFSGPTPEDPEGLTLPLASPLSQSLVKTAQGKATIRT